MKRKRLSKTSLLRILPAAFIGLLPFSLFEDYFLEQHYRLRGAVAPVVEIQVVNVDTNQVDDPAGFARKLAGLTIRPELPCASFLPIALNNVMRRNGWKCLYFDVSDRYAIEDFDDLVPLVRTHFQIVSAAKGQPLFFGGRDVFTNSYLSGVQTGGASGSLQGKLPVFMLSEPIPRVPIKTAYGKLERSEVALNILAATLQDTFLKRFTRSGQWGFSLACALFVATVLYSYPVFFTLIFTLIFCAALWVASLFVFERLGWQLPIAASIMSSVTIYFLGMSDRLDKRERREWLLDQEGDNLRRLDEMRNNFLSLVSHDLKTPIARMRLSLERVLRGDFGALRNDLEDNLKRVLSASGDLQRSISTLLLLGRIENRELRLRREPNDLTEILAESLRAHDAEIRERSIQVVAEFEPMFLIEVDRALILEVVNNLLDNALKYSPSTGRMILRCGELENCPELSPPQPGAWFEIQDEGPGIAASERDQVFKKFFQGHQTQAPRDAAEGIKGTGLGLYLSSYFVREHGGVIQICSRVAGEQLRSGDLAAEYFTESGKPHGTVFRVSLPVSPPPESPEDPILG